MPLTSTEIAADKDRLRAEFAVTARRLEMDAKTSREMANDRFIEINRVREELKLAASEVVQKGETIATLEAAGSELQTQLQQRVADIERLSGKLATLEGDAVKKKEEIEKLGQLYEEASFSSSNRQIELVARESEIEKLNNDVSVLRAQRKEVDKRHQDMMTEGKAAIEALANEKKKLADRERKLERLLSTLADRDETLDRRERELARLKEEMKKKGLKTDVFVNEPGAVANGAQRPQEDRAMQLSPLLLSPLISGTTGDTEEAVAKLNNDRERLEARLTTLVRENKKLRGGASSFETGQRDEGVREQREGALLREQMQDLAAEIITLTATLEGPNSEVAKALAASEGQGNETEDGAAIRSIAERVRALQKAASPS
ncbi:hypothetical protein ACFWXH_26955 [Mesorhizobium sp. NPDC059054]|uniref:hypothetical protein n=1 Tax=Mesorhizobium sp. NPDC059054 TaxID=3346711 RepID=UPI0036B7DC1B